MNDPEINKLITAMAVTNTKLDALTKATNEQVQESRQQRIDHAQQMKELETRVDAKLEKKADSERVKKLEDSKQWLIEKIISYVLIGVLGVTLLFGKPELKPVADTVAGIVR